MNKKAESVKFVVILSMAFILLGIGFVSLSKTPSVTSKTVHSGECYSLENNEMVKAEFSDCCIVIKQSSGCEKYNDNLYKCGDYVVNKEIITMCS